MPNRSMPTHNDLAAKSRQKAVELLNQHLADMLDMYTQTKQAHWNVKGPQFIALHEFFDDIAQSLLEHIDTIAERGTALGGVAQGTARMAAKHSRLPEYPLAAVDGREHVEALTKHLAGLAKTVRAAIDAANDFGDADTADVFTEVSRSLDKHLWMLESHLIG